MLNLTWNNQTNINTLIKFASPTKVWTILNLPFDKVLTCLHFSFISMYIKLKPEKRITLV